MLLLAHNFNGCMFMKNAILLLCFVSLRAHIEDNSNGLNNAMTAQRVPVPSTFVTFCLLRKRSRDGTVRDHTQTAPEALRWLQHVLMTDL